MYKYCNTKQENFILNYDFVIPENHEARLIEMFVDSIPDDIIYEPTSHTGRPAHDPRLLLKIFLYAYSNRIYSGRKIVRFCQDSLSMRWLTRDTYVCYRSLNEFRSSEKLERLLKKAFVYFTSLVARYGLLDGNTLFIDGTKIEADANRYSFTWKAATLNYDAKLNQKINEKYEELIERQVRIALDEEEKYTSFGLEQMMNAVEEELSELDEKIEQEPRSIKGGSANKRRRKMLKPFRTQLKQMAERKKKYEDALGTFNGRNSFSKTDKDATFMCMKEDPMKNRELKPGYNLQIATNHQFVLAYKLFPNPSDHLTLKPFLESMGLLDEFDTIVADAGYGNLDNYRYLEEIGKETLIPYPLFRQEQKRTFKNDPSKRKNWTYDEEGDYYIDHLGVKFSFSRIKETVNKQGCTRQMKIYVADMKQDTPELEAAAKTKTGYQREIKINEELEAYKEKISEKLLSDSGKKIYDKRKTEDESVFGQMKRNFGVRRSHVRGMVAVSNDLGLLFLAMNLQRLGRIQLKNVGYFFVGGIFFFWSIKKLQKICPVFSFLEFTGLIFL